jgi:uncharacterized protein
MVSSTQSNLPDYGQLVKFLFQPFSSETAAIDVDCEYTLDRQRVWIRVAIAGSDQGAAFGRGGRNIQAIRAVLQAAAAIVGQSIHLDVYGSNSGYRERESDRTARDEERSAPRRSPSDDRRSGSSPTRSTPTRRTSGNDGPNIPPPRPRR